MLRKIRLTLAVIFFICISLLFLDFTGTVQECFGWMAKLQFLPSVLALNVVSIIVVLALTILVGRIYCSVICPLGVMQDVFAWIGKWKIFRKNKKAKMANKYSYSKPKTWLRITALILFVVMFVAGFNAFAVLLAPYSSYGRIVSSLIQPIYIGINNLLATIAEKNDSFAFYQVEVHNNPMILGLVASVTALVLFVLAFMNGRTYCNTICPVGTVLGFVSKFSLFKIKVDEDKCIKCGLCEKNCKAACISVKKGEPVKIDYTRCIDCGNCELACAKGAIGLKKAFSDSNNPRNLSNPSNSMNPINPINPRDSRNPRDPRNPINPRNPRDPRNHSNSSSSQADLSRRNFLAVLGMTTAAATINAKEKTTDGGFAAIEDKQVPNRKTPLTPPGSLSARNLQQHCTACQLCISNCPNGVLRPNTSFEHFLQPVMEFEKGYCRPECTRCSSVCPTGAIRPITKEEKTAIQIGHAVWIKKNCVPVADGITCGNCAKHCPTGAIQMVPLEKGYKMNEDGKWTDAEGNPVNENELLRIPVVNTEKCIGCGTCENLCPSRPFSAIYVEGHEVHREI